MVMRAGAARGRARANDYNCPFEGMDTAPARKDDALFGRGPLMAALTRGTSVALALAALLFVWHSPRVRPWPALAVGLGYIAFQLAGTAWRRRGRSGRAAKAVHDLVDAAAVGLGAYFAGGLRGPLWLLLYPHAVAVAVRGGLRYGLAFGALDAAIVTVLGRLDGVPLAVFHALTLLFCAATAGSTGSYLRAVRREQAAALERLTANQERSRLLEDSARAHAERVQSLIAIGQGVVERRQLRDLLPLITQSVNRVMGTRHCVLFLREGDRLRVAAQEGLEEEVVRGFDGLRVGESLSGWIIARREPLAVTEMLKDPRLLFGPMVERFRYRSFLGVPLRRGAEILGTLEVVTKEERGFSAEEQAVMSAFADQAAVAIDNARLLEEAHARVSEVVDANRRLEELNRLRQQYLRNVSHEFRTPLTVIKGYTEFLLEGPPEGESLEDVLRVMSESCDRLIEMVDTLIDVGRLEREDAQRLLQIEPLDLREVTAASVERLRLSAEKKNVDLHLDFPSAALALEADLGLLHQVVRKLVDNAVKYSPAGARVVVRGRQEGDAVALEVEDRGAGIAAEHLPRIFDKFYMVDGGISRRVGGTGVGLYLVREIVRLHHGTVTVRSDPGQGSVFSVRLPRRFAPPPVGTAPS
jgi:signal transduction histidine kinase